MVFTRSRANFSMYDGIFTFGGSLTITSSGDITLLAMASVNVPPQIPFIGGDTLGSINFFLQYQVGGPTSQDVAAAWTTFSILSYSFTIGFEVHFSGNVSIINGNDVAALTANATAENNAPYYYQDNFSIPSNSGSAVAVGAQITITTPILDGPYPLTPGSSGTLSGAFVTDGEYTFSTFSLGQSDIILQSLSFEITLDGTVGDSDIGTGSFTPQGQFVFTPNGNQSIVPTGATLYSDGELVIDWSGYAADLTGLSINASYDVADAYFELLKQGTNDSTTMLGTFTIDPVDNDPGDYVQSAVPADLITIYNDLPARSPLLTVAVSKPSTRSRLVRRSRARSLSRSTSSRRFWEPDVQLERQPAIRPEWHSSNQTDWWERQHNARRCWHSDTRLAF